MVEILRVPPGLPQTYPKQFCPSGATETSCLLERTSVFSLAAVAKDCRQELPEEERDKIAPPPVPGSL